MKCSHSPGVGEDRSVRLENVPRDFSRVTSLSSRDISLLLSPEADLARTISPPEMGLLVEAFEDAVEVSDGSAVRIKHQETILQTRVALHLKLLNEKYLRMNSRIAVIYTLFTRTGKR